MKEVMIEYKQLPFGSYANVIIMELERRSKENSNIIQFPTKPTSKTNYPPYLVSEE